ncbi:HemK family protein methyltransferase [Streptomyces sp. NPDC020965]|uniref:HemK family protein methyltransferase n=1 Tax=Streptomyces sp. NPDC020965 TaxID=3365105 RepID=UPI0037A3912F
MSVLPPPSRPGLASPLPPATPPASHTSHASPVSAASAASLSVVGRLRAAGCVFAEDEAALLMAATVDAADLTALVDRRVAGLPLEHVLGWAEFRGLRIAVDPGVFVPRRRTEFLVHRAVTLARPGAVIVDLCCGSGAVGVALAEELAGEPSGEPVRPPGGTRGGDGPTGVQLPGVQLHCVDIDPAAVRCARRNARAVGGLAYEGDLYDPLPRTLRGSVDVLLANAPYVPTDEIGLLPAEARIHEARVALDGGTDGLDVLRRVAAGAAEWLAPGGSMLSETSERQAAEAREIVARAGLTAWVAVSEEWDATVVAGTRRG